MGPEKTTDALEEIVGIARLALPDCQHVPASGAQRAACPSVARLIALEFSHPVRPASRRDAAPPAAVHVPETSAHVDDIPPVWKHHVRGAGQAADMWAKAIAK